MANVILRTIVQDKSLNPGQSYHWVWNNAIYGRVYVLELVPLLAGDGYNHTSVGEITRQWRSFRTWWVPSDVIKYGYELEIHFVVKNIGNEKLRYSVKMAEIF